MVGGFDDGVLEASWVPQVQVQLALSAVVLLGDGWADVGLELVEAVCDDLCELLVRVPKKKHTMNYEVQVHMGRYI